MIITLKEYIAVAIVILFLVILANTKIKIGEEKFHQLTCAGHLRNLYQSIELCMRDNPGIFADNPSEQWYTLLPDIKPRYLHCPQTPDYVSDDLPTDYALNKKVYDSFKESMAFNSATGRQILILDAKNDRAGFGLFPLVNPDFRHSGGCNILLTNGTVIWCSKDDFSADIF